MGAWGTGIFDDDTALDVRGTYLDYLTNGASDEEATSRTVDDYDDDSEDPDYRITFWTALASTQWEVGRLQENVKHKSLALIAEGDSPLWQDTDEKTCADRQAVLKDLTATLNSPQPPQMPIDDVRKLQAYRESNEHPDESIQRNEHQVQRKWWEFWK